MFCRRGPVVTVVFLNTHRAPPLPWPWSCDSEDTVSPRGAAKILRGVCVCGSSLLCFCIHHQSCVYISRIKSFFAEDVGCMKCTEWKDLLLVDWVVLKVSHVNDRGSFRVFLSPHTLNLLFLNLSLLSVLCWAVACPRFGSERAAVRFLVVWCQCWKMSEMCEVRTMRSHVLCLCSFISV